MRSKLAALAFGLMTAIALVPTQAHALAIGSNNEVIITSDQNQIGEMFDIEFTATSEEIFNAFCFGDCGGLTLADFDGVTLNTTTWWTITDITTSNVVGGDSITFLIDIVDNSTGWDASAEVHSWGFNTDPNSAGAVAGTSGDVDSDDSTSIWESTTTSGNLGGFSIENCIFTPNNCQGGAGGMPLGSSDQIELTLSGDFFNELLLGELIIEPDYAIKYQTGFGGENGAVVCNQTIQDDCFQESLEIAGEAVIKTLPDTQIPEPSTLGLFAIGLAGLGVLARRRRHGPPTSTG